jgi:hypothetical protein
VSDYEKAKKNAVTALVRDDGTGQVAVHTGCFPGLCTNSIVQYFIEKGVGARVNPIGINILPVSTDDVSEEFGVRFVHVADQVSCYAVTSLSYRRLGLVILLP